jgi:hypothetical protein
MFSFGSSGVLWHPNATFEARHKGFAMPHLTEIMIIGEKYFDPRGGFEACGSLEQSGSRLLSIGNPGSGQTGVTRA